MHEVAMSCVNMLKIRKAFFLSLINIFGKYVIISSKTVLIFVYSPLEYDSVHLNKISFFFHEAAGAVTCVFRM